MKNSVEAVVKHLVERAVGFHITHRNPGGATSLPLSAREIIEYAADPVGFLAKHYQVTREEYLGWHEANYAVQCAGTTTKGQRCKAAAVGLTGLYSPKAWAENQGAYCSVHG